MNAQELLDELLALKAVYGSLENVPVSVFIEHERFEITLVDYFTDQRNEQKVLHSIDLNINTEK
jgi:hypothetical protein